MTVERPSASAKERRGLTAGSAAQVAGGRVEGDPALPLTGIAGLRAARPGELSFVLNEKNVRLAGETGASVLLLPETMGVPADCKAAAFIRVSDVEDAVNRLAAWLAPQPGSPAMGVHPSAVVGRSVALGQNVSVGPCAVVEDEVRLGDNVTVEAQVFVGRGVAVGDNTRIEPGVQIGYGCVIGRNVILHSGVVIGGDGFGYEFKGGVHEKVPQLGNVVIEDDVEIGSGTTVDRARFGSTRIGQGTKIDNLVMIAHNVQLGRHCIIVAQAGIAGSTVIGDYVMIGGQAGIVGHVRIGDRALIAAGASVTKDVPAGAQMLGAPAEPREEGIRILMGIRRLPRLYQKVRRVARKVNELCKKADIEEIAEND